MSISDLPQQPEHTLLSEAGCSPADHAGDLRFQLPIREEAVEQAARIFRALGEPARLRLVARLAQGASCVSELASSEAESITVVSQRLRVLRADNIVRRRREGKHMLYFLADQHMLDLVFNALAHASEKTATPNTASHT